jgi:hypothetical protein
MHHSCSAASLVSGPTSRLDMDIRPLIGRDEDHSLGDARPTSKSQYPDILRDAKAVRIEGACERRASQCSVIDRGLIVEPRGREGRQLAAPVTSRPVIGRPTNVDPTVVGISGYVLQRWRAANDSQDCSAGRWSISGAPSEPTIKSMTPRPLRRSPVGHQSPVSTDARGNDSPRGSVLRQAPNDRDDGSQGGSAWPVVGRSRVSDLTTIETAFRTA